MPVYVCKAGGEDTEEPWKHVVQVYAEPFYYESDDDDNNDGGEEHFESNLPDGGDHHQNQHKQYRHSGEQPQARETAAQEGHIVNRPHRPPRARVNPRNHVADSVSNHSTSAVAEMGSATSPKISERSHMAGKQNIPIPIRRVRHSEIVLVDCVFVSHGRYWLRLVFPGDDETGGNGARNHPHEYAGCIALQSVSRMPLRQALLDHMESLKRYKKHHHHGVPEYLYHDDHHSPKSRLRQIANRKGGRKLKNRKKGYFSQSASTDDEYQNAMMHYVMDRLTTKDHQVRTISDQGVKIISSSETRKTTITSNFATMDPSQPFEPVQGSDASTTSPTSNFVKIEHQKLFEIMHADILLAIMMARGSRHSPLNTKRHNIESSTHKSLLSASSHVAHICERKRHEWLAECTAGAAHKAQDQSLMTQDEFHQFWEEVLLSVDLELMELTSATTTTSKPSFFSSGDINSSSKVLCYETGLFFPSNPLVLELLPEYDDGLKLKEKYEKQKIEKEQQQLKRSQLSFLGSLTSSTRSVLFDGDGGGGSTSHDDMDNDEDDDAEGSSKVGILDHELSDEHGDQILLGPSAGAETDVDEDIDIDDEEDLDHNNSGSDNHESDDDDDDGPHGDEELIAVEPVFCRICREGIHDVEFEGGVESPPSASGQAEPPTATTTATTTAGVAAAAASRIASARQSPSPPPPNLPPPPPPLHQMEFQQRTQHDQGGRLDLSSSAAQPNTASALPSTPGGFAIYEDAQESHDHYEGDKEDFVVIPQDRGQNAMPLRVHADASTLVKNNSSTSEDKKPSAVTIAQSVELFPVPSFLCQPVNVERLKKLIKIHPYMENPMIAPCKCTGSMAFVHYLCVEQWRARARHPDARMGRNCETCKAPYTLPPPTLNHIPEHERGRRGDGDGLPGAGGDAVMAPHVLQALGRPHLWWRIGVFLVQKPYLRPLCPIILSPLVAMYCRARRTLKKRGVSRRRWSCSLCRRRARWKCVRCLRSYYCSRQCQNVSWHILHKHVCYKPSRFWGSVAAYSLGVLVLLPDIRTFPLLYILGVFWCIPYSFTAVGVLGGSLASVLKKMFRVDVRGRYLELSVVFVTAVVSRLLWGLLWGYFGYPQYCTGLTMYILDWITRLSAVATSFNLSHASRIAKVANGTYIPWYLLSVVLSALGAVVVIPLDIIGTMIALVNKRVDNSLRQYFWMPVARTLTRTNVEYGQKKGLIYSLLCSGTSNGSAGQSENLSDGIGGYWNDFLRSISDKGWLSSGSSPKSQSVAEEKISIQKAFHRWMMETLMLQPGVDDMMGIDMMTDSAQEEKIDQDKKKSDKGRMKKKDEKDAKRKMGNHQLDQNVNTQEDNGGKLAHDTDAILASEVGTMDISDVQSYEETQEGWMTSKSSFPFLFSSSRSVEHPSPIQIDAATRFGFGVNGQGDSKTSSQSSSLPFLSSASTNISSSLVQPPSVCFKQLQYINPDFTVENETCAADLQFLAPLLQLAAFCALFTLLWNAIVTPAIAAANAARRRRRGGGGGVVGGGGGGFAAGGGVGRRPFNGGGMQQRVLGAARRQEGRGGGPAVAQVDRAIRMARRRMAEQQARAAAVVGGGGGGGVAGADVARVAGAIRNIGAGEGNAPDQQAQEQPLHLHQD